MEKEDSLIFIDHDDGDDSKQRGKSSNTIWGSYKAFVRRNHVSLELLEAGLSRILFWTPTTAEDKCANLRNRQREVLYGILSLHRLAMDIALEDENLSNNDEYGMSVRTDRNGDSINNNSRANWLETMSPTRIRIAITVLQSLLPSLLELGRSETCSENVNYQRQGRIRLVLERVKFVLRVALLGSYWGKLIKHHYQKRYVLQEDTIPPLSIGLMRDGGLYFQQQQVDNIPSVLQEDALWRRHNYTGRRTGRAVIRRSPQASGKNPIQNDTSARPTTNSNWAALFVMLGELLYAYRPLHWANAEASISPSYRNWLLSVAMDLVSLQCCRLNHSTSINNATQQELKRRKMRLLLYLLRAPIWNKVTEPASDRVEAGMERVPILGRLAATYIRDWLWYMKHPYMAEQG